MHKNSLGKQLKEDKKKIILSSALKVFCEKGYEATTVDDIAKKVGMSHGLFYHYFKSKKEIFEQVMIAKRNFSIEGLKEKVNKATSSIDKISIIANDLLDNLKNDENCAYYFYFFISEMFRLKDKGKKIIHPPENCDNPFIILETIFAEGQKNGELIEKYSPKECAVLFISVIQGATLGYAIAPKDMQKQMTLPSVDFISDIFAKKR